MNRHTIPVFRLFSKRAPSPHAKLLYLFPSHIFSTFFAKKYCKDGYVVV